MEKNTVLQLVAVGATVVVSVAAKLFAPQPTSLFGFTQPSTPIITMPDSAEVAVAKAGAIKDLVESDAFKQALPTAQKNMLDAVKSIFN